MKKFLFTLSLVALILVFGQAGEQDLGGVTLLRVKPRIVTPNNDASSDKVFFEFDTGLSGLPIETTVLDINGAKVSSLNLDSNDFFLTWDGKDSSGRNLPAGIYIYSIRLGKNIATG